MDPKIVERYRSKSAKSVFLDRAPKPRDPRDPYWILLVGAVLAGAAIVLFALPFLKL